MLAQMANSNQLIKKMLRLRDDDQISEFMASVWTFFLFPMSNPLELFHPFSKPSKLKFMAGLLSLC